MDLPDRPPRSLIQAYAVILTPRVASRLERILDVPTLARQNPADLEFIDALAAIRAAAGIYRGSVEGTPVAAVAEQPRSSSVWVETPDAASLLGVTTAAIRMAIRRKRLPAERAGGRWRIRRTDLDTYRAETDRSTA